MACRHTVADGDFNLLEEAMPLLDSTDCELAVAKLVMLQPILKHIYESMCCGVVEDNDITLGWMAYVA